jgi:phospholipid transport system substrate-binding protein
MVCAFTVISSPKTWATPEPGRVIVETIEKGLMILRDPSLQVPERLAERRQKLWETLEPVFNFDEITKRSLGRYWKERTPEERREFRDIFVEILKDAYLGKSDSYSGQSIVYLRETVLEDKSKVQTNFITSDKKEIAVDFNMINRNDQWQIYDVIIEGVSMVGNYRSQFDSILTDSTFEELMQKMRIKRQEFVEEGSGVKESSSQPYSPSQK